MDCPHARVHSSAVHRRQKAEAMQVSVIGRMDEPKEGDSDTCCNVHETWRHYAKGDEPHTKGQIPHDST